MIWGNRERKSALGGLTAGVSDGAAQHGESVVFGVVDLQVPEGFSDIVANEFLGGGRL
jgi:hypothetical protein